MNELKDQVQEELAIAMMTDDTELIFLLSNILIALINHEKKSGLNKQNP